MKILPIEINPYIKAYSYHSFPLSILGSNLYCGEKKAELLIEDSKEYNWNLHTNDAEIIFDKNSITVGGDKYADNIKAIICREASSNDEITVKIRYIQYTQPYGYVCLFFSDEEITNSNLINNECFYNIGVYNKGNVFSGKTQNLEIHDSILCTDFGYFIKLERRENKVLYWFSFDEKDWKFISENEIEKYNYGQKYYIGVKLVLGENQYYNWFFTNHIHLYGRNVFTSQYLVDYFVTPEKDGEFYTVHSLLDFSKVDKEIIIESGADPLEFIKRNINSNKYIDIMLNEFYIVDTAAYNKNTFYHGNLIFGYDEIGIYILGYIKGGYLKARRIEYESFLRAMDHNHKIMRVIWFSSLDNYFQLNIDTIKRSLYEFWKGVNINLGIEFVLPKDKRNNRMTTIMSPNKDFDDNLPRFINMYGINIYTLFIENEIMFRYLLKDIRISFVLYEHKKIMKDRVLFLIKKNHIKTEYINEILKITDELLNKTSIFLNKLIKYQIKTSAEADIKADFEKIKELEEKYYPKLIDSLY